HERQDMPVGTIGTGRPGADGEDLVPPRASRHARRHGACLRERQEGFQMQATAERASRSESEHEDGSLAHLLKGYRFSVCEGPDAAARALEVRRRVYVEGVGYDIPVPDEYDRRSDRKSTRLNSSHGSSSYAVFCLKNK